MIERLRLKISPYILRYLISLSLSLVTLYADINLEKIYSKQVYINITIASLF